MTRKRQERRDGESWYRISASAGSPAQILIYDEIGFFGVTAQDFLRDLDAITGPVEVKINSPGGDPFEAYAIYNALCSRPGVTTVVDSLAASAASVIVMAGEQRLMAKTSQLMIHDAWAVSDGNASDLQHMAARLDMCSGQLAGIYADTAGGSQDFWREQMRAETWYTPQEALSAGLITGITGSGRKTAPARVPAEAASAAAGGIRAATQPWDPDGDGDDDSMPEGDTDHSHWTADGVQKKSVPGKPMPGQPPADAAAPEVVAAAGARHEPVAGSHDHPHPAYGSQGGDAMHAHQHEHAGDAAHDHTHGSAMPGDSAPPAVHAASADDSAWDASKAWANGAASDDPAAFYGGICAGRKDGDKSTQDAWALPYRYTPSSAPNADGVKNALSRLPQTQGLTNEAGAKALLQKLMKQVNPDYEPASQSDAAVQGTSGTVSPLPEPARPPAGPKLPPPAAPVAATTPSKAGPLPDGHASPERKTVTTTTMTIEDRAARRGEIEARLTGIGTEHGDAALPEEVQSEWDTLSAELGEHGRILDAHQQALGARRAELARIAARQEGERVSDDAGYAPAEGTPAGNGNGHGQPARVSASLARGRTDDSIYDVIGLRSRASGQEDFAARARDNALRAVERGTFPGSASREDAQGKVERLLNSVDDEDGTLARRIMVTGSPVYMRAWAKMVARRGTAGLTADEAKALEFGRMSAALGTTGADGGFAVPFQLDPSVILTSDGAINPLRQISRVETIVGKEYDLVTSAGVTVTRSAEATPMADNSPLLAQPAIKVERVTGFIPFSMEIEEDWASMQNQMMMLLADAKDVEESSSFTNGSGVSPAAGGIISTLSSASNVTGTGGAGVLALSDLYALEDASAPRFRATASFMASKTTFNAYRQLFIQDASAAGDQWVRPSQGSPAELIGYPAYEDSDMTAAHTTGSKPIILGDFKRGFIIVDRLGMSSEIAPILFDPTTGRPTGQRGLVLFWRNNSRVLVDNAFRLLVVG